MTQQPPAGHHPTLTPPRLPRPPAPPAPPRRTTDTTTSDQLDELQDDLARTQAALSDMIRDRDRQQWYRNDALRKMRIHGQRADQAEAALARVRKAIDSVKAAGHGHTPTTPYDKGVAQAVDWVTMRVLEAIDARLVNQAEPAAAQAIKEQH